MMNDNHEETDLLLEACSAVNQVTMNLLPKEFQMKQFGFIVDANVIFSQITGDIRGTNKAPLRKILAVGIFKIQAPNHLIKEIEEHAGAFAKKVGMTREEYLKHWEKHYQKYINFIPTERLKTPRIAKHLRDPDDLEYVKAYTVSNTDFVLSGDKHLQNLNITTKKEPALILMDLREYVNAGTAHTILVSGSMVIIPVVKNVFDVVFNLIKKNPILAIIVIYVTYKFLTDKRPSELFKDMLASIIKIFENEKIQKLLMTAGSFKSKEFELEAERGLKKQRTGLHFYLKVVLLKNAESLSPQLIMKKAREHGYKGRFSIPYLLKVLRSDRDFHCDDAGNWRISKR